MLARLVTSKVLLVRTANLDSTASQDLITLRCRALGLDFVLFRLRKLLLTDQPDARSCLSHFNRP